MVNKSQLCCKLSRIESCPVLHDRNHYHSRYPQHSQYPHSKLNKLLQTLIYTQQRRSVITTTFLKLLQSSRLPIKCSFHGFRAQTFVLVIRGNLQKALQQLEVMAGNAERLCSSEPEVTTQFPRFIHRRPLEELQCTVGRVCVSQCEGSTMLATRLATRAHDTGCTYSQPAPI